MSKKILAAAFAAMMTAMACAQDAAPAVTIDAKADSISRAVAMVMADGVGRSIDQLGMLGVPVDRQLFAGYIAQALKGQDLGMTVEAADAYIDGLVRASAGVPPKAQTVDVAQQAAFVDSIAALPGAKKLDSGVIVVTETAGQGAFPGIDDSVDVKYQGRLADGTVFDDTQGQPVHFSVNALVPGFTQGLQQMQPGGKYRLVIPADKAYGSTGAGGVIPPDAVLDFSVELVSITPEAKPE